MVAAMIDVAELSQLKLTVIDPPHLMHLATGIGIVLISAALYLVFDRSPTTTQIVGRWLYEVTDANCRITHAGVCEISKSGEYFSLVGERRVLRKFEDGNDSVYLVSIQWNSSWAFITPDNCLRFEYTIALPTFTDTQVNLLGFCQIPLPKKRRPSSAKGHYHILPPTLPEATNTQRGQIHIKRIGRSENVDFAEYLRQASKRQIQTAA